MGPGFQMSFAATTALVVAFSVLRAGPTSRVLRWVRGAMLVVFSSAVAGAVTAPIAAAHFDQMSRYELIVNVVSVPLMGALVMPAGVFFRLNRGRRRVDLGADCDGQGSCVDIVGRAKRGKLAGCVAPCGSTAVMGLGLADHGGALANPVARSVAMVLTRHRGLRDAGMDADAASSAVGG